LLSRLSELIQVIFAGTLVGSKLGYAETSHRYYSWLGGLHPDFRQRGIGSCLMEQQHMLRLNQRSGFETIGTYARRGGPGSPVETPGQLVTALVRSVPISAGRPSLAVGCAALPSLEGPSAAPQASAFAVRPSCFGIIPILIQVSYAFQDFS
jgi:hypothetical protein